MSYNNFGVSNTERGVLRASSGSPHLTGTLQASLLPALGTSRLLINDTDLLQRWQQIAVDGRDRNDCMKEMMSSFPGPVQLEYIKLIIEYTLLQREQYGDLLVASYDWYETQNLYRHFPEGQQHVNALSNELGEDFLTTVKAARLEVSDRAAAVRAIEKRWEMPFSTAIPEEFRPGTVGRHFAKAFNKLTKYCTHEEAWGKDSKDGLLQPIIRARIEGGTRGAFRLSLTLRDLETALSQMNPEASTDTRMVLRNLPDKSALMKHSTTTAKRPWSGRSNKTSSKKSRGLIQSEQNTVTDEGPLDTCIVATPASAKPQSGGLASESPTLGVSTAFGAAANDGNGLQGPRKTGDAELEETSPGCGLDVDIHHPENMALTNSQGLLAGIEADPQKSSLAADADSNTVNATRLTSGALQSQDSGNNTNLNTVTPNVPSCPDSETGRPGAAKPGKLPELIAETVAGSNLLPHQSKQSRYSQLEAQYQADRDKVVNEANSAAPDKRVEILDDSSDFVSDLGDGDGQGHEEEDQHPNNRPRIAEKKPTLSLRSPKNPQETSYTGQSLVQKTLVSSLLSEFRDWETLDVGLVCQKLKAEENDLTEKKKMLDELEKSLEISRAKLDDDRRILRQAQLENHAAFTSVERQRNEVQNKISSLNLSRDLLRQCVLQIAPLLLTDNDPAMGTSYYESLQDIIVQNHLDLSREVVAQKRIDDQATARLNQRTAAYEEQMIKTSTLTIANASLEDQLAAAMQSNKEKDQALLNLRSALESVKSNELITANIKHEKTQIKEAHERLQALHHDTKIKLIDCSARLREMERNAADVEAYEDCMESLQRKIDSLKGSLKRADSELASANEKLLVSNGDYNRSLELERENCSLKKRIASLEDGFSVREMENDANIRKLTRVQDQNATYAEALRRSHEDAHIKAQTIQDGDKRLKQAFASNLKLELSLRAEKESLTLMRFKKESLDMQLSSLLAGQLPGAGDSQEAEWKMAKIRLDCLIERMQTDLAAVADAKKAWDDRVLQLRKDSRRDK